MIGLLDSGRHALVATALERTSYALLELRGVEAVIESLERRRIDSLVIETEDVDAPCWTPRRIWSTRSISCAPKNLLPRPSSTRLRSRCRTEPGDLSH